MPCSFHVTLSLPPRFVFPAGHLVLRPNADGGKWEGYVGRYGTGQVRWRTQDKNKSKNHGGHGGGERVTVLVRDIHIHSHFHLALLSRSSGLSMWCGPSTA